MSQTGERTPKMNDMVKNPKHYAHPSGVEVIEITRHESFLRGNIIKYVLRAPYKGSELEDLKKAAQYLEWEIERIERGIELSQIDMREIEDTEAPEEEDWIDS